MLPVILDGNSIVTRCIMATALDDLKAGGLWTGGVFGTLRMLRAFLDDPARSLGPIYAFFDCGVPEKRLKFIPEYKAERKERKKLLSDEEKEKAFMQLGMAREMLDYLGVLCLSYQNREADDCVAAAVRILVGEKREPVVWSSDRDLLQTVKMGASVCNGKEWIDADNFQEHTGVPINRYLLYRALVGDPSDGIKGAAGCGPVRASKLLTEGSREHPLQQLDNLCEELQKVPKPKKFEQAIAGDGQRLGHVIQGIDLSNSFGKSSKLRERMLSHRPVVDQRTFLSFCKKLHFDSVLGDPVKYLRPFQRAAKGG